jgi:hypothetical protein
VPALRGGAAGLLFALLAVFGPGIAVQRLLRLKADVALAIPLGLLLTAAFYLLGLSLGVPLLAPLLVLGLDASLLVKGDTIPRIEWPPLRLLAPFLAFVFLLALTEYPLNRRAGDFVLDPVLPEDAAFHAGLTWELSEAYPPEVPGFSGRVMAYHFGLPLVRAAALRFASILPYDSLTRLDNTLGVLGLILVLPGAVVAMGGTPRAAGLAPWFLLATDFSFLLAWGRKIPFWITTTKGSDVLFSLLQSNATVPALMLALALVVALHHHGEGRGRGFLFLALFLGIGTAFFKVFVAGQLLLGLLLALPFARNRRPLLAVGLPLALALAALALGPGGRGEGVFFEPLVVLRDVRQSLGLAPASLAPPGSFVLLWVVLSLGLRVVGLPSAFSALGSRDGVRLTLAGMALCGWPLGLLFRISPLESPDRPQNEALYFFEQSGLILWVFVAVALGRVRVSGIRAGLLFLVVALLTLPSTVQFVCKKVQLSPGHVPGEVLDAMEALSALTRPGDVILERPRIQRFPPPPVVFIGRRVPFTSYFPFLTQWVPKAALEERQEMVREFFETEDRDRAFSIARSLGARAVCLYGSDTVRFDTSGLREVFSGSLVRAYLLPSI